MPTPKRPYRGYIVRKDGMAQRYLFSSRAAWQAHPQRILARKVPAQNRRARKARQISAPVPPREPKEKPSGRPLPRERRTDEANVRRVRGREYRTYFRAWGTLGTEGADLSKADAYNRFVEVEEENAEELGYAFDVPGAFRSQMVLGQVRWDGVKLLKELVGELNSLLQFGVPDRDFDFREFYHQWGYTYRVREGIGGQFRDVAVKKGGLDGK